MAATAEQAALEAELGLEGEDFAVSSQLELLGQDVAATAPAAPPLFEWPPMAGLHLQSEPLSKLGTLGKLSSLQLLARFFCRKTNIRNPRKSFELIETLRTSNDNLGQS